MLNLNNLMIISEGDSTLEEDFSYNFLLLQERRQAKAAGKAVTRTKTEPKKACATMLWRAFQFAFRVYSFAGGHDDRADKLTRELAHEIETGSHDQ
jgi:formin 2/Wiskott-Aldrich syndrome protein